MKKWLFFAALVLTACAQKADLELAKDLGNSEMIHHPALWTCAVAGLGGNPFRDGTYDYYIHERICENDPKGIAPLILACLELAK